MNSVLLNQIMHYDVKEKLALEEKRNEVMSSVVSGRIPLKEIAEIPIKYLDFTRLPEVPEQNIMTPSRAYKPFRYDFGYKMWERQNQIHWLHTEIPLGQDIQDWKTKLSDADRNLATHIFPLFVQNDVLVNNVYIHQYAPLFQPNEIQLGISAIANMECFDSETDLLTADGWKNVKDLTMDDTLAQYDISTQTVSFTKPKKVVNYPYKGIMHHYKNQTTDIMVTPNHDMIARRNSTGEVIKVKSEKLILGRNYTYPASGTSIADHVEMTSFERLLVAIQADGCLRGNCPSAGEWRTVDVVLHKHRKIYRLIELLEECGLPYSIKLKSGNRSIITFNLPEGIEISKVKDFGFLSLDKISAQKAIQFIEEIVFWDGTVDKTNGHMAYYSTRPKAVDVVQSLAAISGLYIATIGVSRKSGSSVILPNGNLYELTKDHFVVSFVKGRIEKTYPHREEIEYDGYVYCVSVEKENIISRRNGKVAFTGNCIHQVAYSHLLTELGFSDNQYSVFLEYKEMIDKYNFTAGFRMDTLLGIAVALLVFGAFTEGVQLFGSFIMLFNYSRHNKLKGMGQVVSFSVRDESLHVQFVAQIYKNFMREFGHLIDQERLHTAAYDAIKTIVQGEHKFIDLAFELGPVEGMTAEETKLYINNTADMRLQQFGLDPIYHDPNPFEDWSQLMMGGHEHANFFETRASGYSKGATKGTWEEAFA